jgi:hypothetical protein
MNIEAFLLCDCATDSAGKLNVLGAFDSIYAKTVPVVHPACTLAARVRFSKIEEGEHKIRVDIIDADGKAVVPRLDGKISVQIRGETDSAVTNLILNLQRIKLERYGEYRIDLAIDGELRGSLPFNVRELPSQGD